MSRGGYDWMTDYVEAERQKKWEEQRKSMEAESSSTVLEPLPDLQRHETWAAAQRRDQLEKIPVTRLKRWQTEL